MKICIVSVREMMVERLAIPNYQRHIVGEHNQHFGTDLNTYEAFKE